MIIKSNSNFNGTNSRLSSNYTTTHDNNNTNTSKLILIRVLIIRMVIETMGDKVRLLRLVRLESCRHSHVVGLFSFVIEAPYGVCGD